jgi:PBSX family phage terminase large subunit
MIRRLQKSNFKFKEFSVKQKKVLTWWIFKKDFDGIICDGAIRSGKTVSLAVSFVIWAMSSYNDEIFAMCGKTIGSFRRNVWLWLKQALISFGYVVNEVRNENLIHITFNDVTNTFFVFGGRDESSQDLIQGLSLAGCLFDEAVLMPESFINQAAARCSIEGSKLWFNCNPSGPFHYFKVEWIDKLKEKNLLRVKFKIDDNLTLSQKVKDRYRKMFQGVFYQRYINGEWVMAEGIIYSMFTQDMVIERIAIGIKINKKWIGVDYGQSNATTFILVGIGSDNKFYILDEYFHSGKDSQIQKSPQVYAKDFKKWLIKNGVDGMPVVYDKIFIDPSAKGFMLQLHQEGIREVRQADNSVNNGIELMSSIIQSGLLRVLSTCKNTITEFSSYSWDAKAQQRGEDIPVKKNDHCMDALRYIANGTRIIWQRLVVNKK